MKQIARITLYILVLALAVACRQQTLSVENINIDVTVTDSLVGETTLIVAVTDSDGNAIENPGTLSIRGDMDHAGMVPVLRDVSESDNGVFTVPFEWTMGGAWTLEVTLTLENGEVATETFNYEILSEAGEDDMGDMDMGDMESTEEADMGGVDMDSEEGMGDMPHGSGETSAVYMTITNNGDETVTIVSAETDVANLVEIHETVVENDVARMLPIESIVIESGETVELRPGGKHIMLMQLTQDIAIDDEFGVTLNFESGESGTVDVTVFDMMMMDEVDSSTTVGDLEITNFWARPASAGMAMGSSSMDMDSEDSDMDMGDMDMDATEEPADSD